MPSFNSLKYVLVSLSILHAGVVVEASEKNSKKGAEQDTAVYSAQSMGTAWALTQRHVVTNYHVINGSKNLRLVTSDNKEIPVQLVLADKKNDLAVLFVLDENTRMVPLPLALTKSRLGSRVFTIGYPHPNLMGISPKLTSGYINATSGLADDPRTIQVSVPVQSGNSGGPLLNMRGEVVGIITSKLSAQKMFEWTGDIPQNVNYAIKVNRLSSLISELETNERITAGNNKTNKNLEALAEKIVSSVMIVAGDRGKEQAEIKHDLFMSKQKNKLPSVKSNKTIIVYSYAEPGNYDLSENIKGSDTIESYSKNTLNVITQQLQKYLDHNIKFIAQGGGNAGDIYYRIEDVSFNKALCSNNSANNIVASYSEKEPGASFRYVSFRMIECNTLKEFKKRYTIERDETNDGFGYEVALHTSFKDFLLKTPSYINW